MNDTGLAILITVLVITGLVLLVFLVWCCCGRKGTFPRISYTRKNNKITIGVKKRDVLIKRCDQTNTKYVEDHIIKSLQLEERAWDQALDKGQDPVIVFCVISSRIGTDIKNAMRGVKGNKRVILVWLHFVLEEMLKGDLADDDELLDTTMKSRMKGIAHFAFDREGLYDCHQNSLGFEKLRYFVSNSMQ